MANILTARYIIEKSLATILTISHYSYITYKDFKKLCDIQSHYFFTWWQHILNPIYIDCLSSKSLRSYQFGVATVPEHKITKKELNQLSIALRENKIFTGIDLFEEHEDLTQEINRPIDAFCSPYHCFQYQLYKEPYLSRYREIEPYYLNIEKEIEEVCNKISLQNNLLEQLEIAYYTDKIKICGEWQGENTRIIINNWEEIEKLFNLKSIPNDIIELYKKTAKEQKTGGNDILIYLYSMQGMSRKKIAEELGLSKESLNNISLRKIKGQERAKELNLPNLEQYKKG